jgi:integrase
MYPAFMLARNAGLRDTEIKTMTWGQVNLKAKSLQVGKSKSDAGEGRVVPLNAEFYNALVDHHAWYQEPNRSFKSYSRFPAALGETA